jgi:hypothetical protein
MNALLACSHKGSYKINGLRMAPRAPRPARSSKCLTRTLDARELCKIWVPLCRGSQKLDLRLWDRVPVKQVKDGVRRHPGRSMEQMVAVLSLYLRGPMLAIARLPGEERSGYGAGFGRCSGSKGRRDSQNCASGASGTNLPPRWRPAPMPVVPGELPSPSDNPAQ